MRCQNRLSNSSFCGAQISEDEQYVITQKGIVLCESCVDTRVLNHPIIDERDSIGRYNIGGQVKANRKSAPSSIWGVKTTTREWQL